MIQTYLEIFFLVSERLDGLLLPHRWWRSKNRKVISVFSSIQPLCFRVCNEHYSLTGLLARYNCILSLTCFTLQELLWSLRDSLNLGQTLVILLWLPTNNAFSECLLVCVCVCVCVCVWVRLTLVWLGSSIPLSAAPGGSLQQLSEVMFEHSSVQLLSITAQHGAGHLSTVEIHKLSPAHWAEEETTQRGRDYNYVYWRTAVEEELHYLSKSTNTTM